MMGSTFTSEQRSPFVWLVTAAARADRLTIRSWVAILLAPPTFHRVVTGALRHRPQIPQNNADDDRAFTAWAKE